MNIILLGPPGSGKGTQADKIIEAYGLMHVSTGNMLRKEIADGTELGEKAKAIMDAGNLVSDDIIIGMIRNLLTSAQNDKGYLFDGFPRTVPQAEALDKLYDELGMKVDYALNIDVSDDEVIRRISNRRSCVDCGATYHLLYKAPKAEGICDVCKHALVQRDDDKPEVVKQRLGNYHKQTSPLIAFYEQKSLLVNVNGERAIDEIAQDISKIIG
jgi:adenylate kinase